MIELKQKPCKGTGKAKDYGCSEPTLHRHYGLCNKCYAEWLRSTPEGLEKLIKCTAKVKKDRVQKIKKDQRETKQSNSMKNKNFNLYKSTAWKWCSRYVLLYYADSNNIVQCSTSPNLSYHITDRNIHVGHFIKYRYTNSTNNSTALVFENLAPQSASDNVNAGGKPDVMRRWLIEKHGEEKINSIEVMKRQALKLDKYTLFEVSEKYRKLFNDLLIKRGIENPWKN